VQPRHLFENTVLVERTLANGTTLRLKLEPLEGKRVNILEYWRQAKVSGSFKRIREQEGQILPFEKLKLEQSFTELFELKEAA